ncbi:MAG: lysyl oxidase family protein [bacterium]
MNKIILSALTIVVSFNISAQTFTGTGGYVEDYNGGYYRQEFLCEVYNLPERIDSAFGLEQACINILHNRVSDLKITLEAPDGSSIWLTNRNGKDNGMNYSNTCFDMEAAEYIHRGEAPFTGNFIPDGRMEYLNNGQNPNGYWKLIIEDLKKGFDGKLESFSLFFGSNPARLKIKKKCSFENAGLCDCMDGTTSCELLPDLVLLPSFTENQIMEYAWDDSLYPGQLKLAASIANIGYGPMEIIGSNEWYCGEETVNGSIKCADGNNSRQQIYQRIYIKNGSEFTWKDVKSGTMYYDEKPGHDHFHVDDWVEFRLVDTTNENEKIVLARGQKVSYCLFNSGICSSSDNVCNIYGQRYGEDMPNFGLGDYFECSTGKQGISVGGYDTYGMLYEGQFLQLPQNLKSGEYLLEIEIDPDNKYVESNKDNNSLRMKIIIQKQEQSD